MPSPRQSHVPIVAYPCRRKNIHGQNNIPVIEMSKCRGEDTPTYEKGFMMKITASLDELDTVVSYLQSTLPPHAIVFLRGDLAAGKTTLTQAIARAQGIEGDVTSPTFSLHHVYSDTLYHYDLYRLDMEEFLGLGLFEEFEHEGWHMVEWGSVELEALLRQVGFPLYEVAITPENGKRIYKIREL